MHDIVQMLMMGAAGQSGQASREAGGSEAGNLASVTTFTTAALSIGTAAADRIVLVAVTVDEQSFGTPVITAMTVGGTSAAELVRYSTTRHCTAIWALAVPTGTTAAIGVTINQAVEAYSLAISAVYGVVPSPAYTVGSAPAGSGDITGVRNGVVITATGSSSGVYSGSVTVDSNVTSGASAYCACQKAYALPTSTGTVSPLSGGTGGYPYAAVSFAPI